MEWNWFGVVIWLFIVQVIFWLGAWHGWNMHKNRLRQRLDLIAKDKE